MERISRSIAFGRRGMASYESLTACSLPSSPFFFRLREETSIETAALDVAGSSTQRSSGGTRAFCARSYMNVSAASWERQRLLSRNEGGGGGAGSGSS